MQIRSCTLNNAAMKINVSNLSNAGTEIHMSFEAIRRKYKNS